MKTDRSQVSAGVTGKLKRHVGSEPGSGAAGWCKPRCHPTPNRGFVWQPVKFTADTRTTLQRQWHSRRKEWGCGKAAWWSRACARQKQNRERSHQKGALGGSIFACPSFRFHQAPAKAKHGQSSTRARSTKEERGKQKKLSSKIDLYDYENGFTQKSDTSYRFRQNNSCVLRSHLATHPKGYDTWHAVACLRVV